MYKKVWTVAEKKIAKKKANDCLQATLKAINSKGNFFEGKATENDFEIKAVAGEYQRIRIVSKNPEYKDYNEELAIKTDGSIDIYPVD